MPEPSTSLHRASENVASQPGIEAGTSCTAGEYSMKRAIRTAVFSCHSGSHLCCYSSPQVAIGDRGWIWFGCVKSTHGDPTVCMSLRKNCASRRGHHYVEAWPEPSTSLHRASENVVSQPGIAAGTSCTAGEYSMKRAIRTAVFSCHSGSHMCCYSTIFHRTLANSNLEIAAAYNTVYHIRMWVKQIYTIYTMHFNSYSIYKAVLCVAKK